MRYEMTVEDFKKLLSEKLHAEIINVDDNKGHRGWQRAKEFLEDIEDLDTYEAIIGLTKSFYFDTGKKTIAVLKKCCLIAYYGEEVWNGKVARVEKTAEAAKRSVVCSPAYGSVVAAYVSRRRFISNEFSQIFSSVKPIESDRKLNVPQKLFAFFHYTTNKLKEEFTKIEAKITSNSC